MSKQNHEWEPYDPTWLVELAREQRPNEEWFITALAECTMAIHTNDVIIHFVDRINAAPYKSSIILESPLEGSVVLDVAQDNRIRGVEFLGRTLKKLGERKK